jgi:hypothetical protein
VTTSKGGNRSALIVGFVIQRYNKKIKPPNFSPTFYQNNNYFLDFAIS